MGKLYGAAPRDDVKLAAEVMPWVESLQGAMPDTAGLRELTAQQGTDFATAAFYHAIRAMPRHRRFIDRVDRQAVTAVQAQRTIRLLVVPAFFYREYPEVGGDGQHIIDVARACGMAAELVPVHSTGRVGDNIEIVRDALQSAAGSEIWLMSMSKGGAEIRLLLQQQGNRLPLDDLRLWFNVSGLVNGCDLVDHMLGSPLRRIKTRALCAATGAEYAAMEELLTDRPCWRQNLILPPRLQVINVFGLPLISHLQKALLARYHRLKHLGPNDGMVLLSRAYVPAGLIYPLWGADHFMRDARVVALLYQLFGLFLSLPDGALPESLETVDLPIHENTQTGMESVQIGE